MRLEDLPLNYQTTVREEHIDMMGHMNVMYYTWFTEMATIDLYDSLGLNNEYYAESGCGSFILEDHTSYLNELRLGDKVSIYSRLIDRGDKTIHFINFMRRDRDGALAATAEKIGLHIDMTSRRGAPMPNLITNRYDALLAQHQALDWGPPLCGSMGIR